VEYLSDGNESLQISITDASGRMVRNESWVVSAGSNVKNLDLDSGLPGLYFLQLKGRKGISTVRILKH
jgi:hypothetical protein